MLNVFFFLLLFEKIVDLEKNLKKTPTHLGFTFFSLFFLNPSLVTHHNNKKCRTAVPFLYLFSGEVHLAIGKKLQNVSFFPFFLLLNRQQH